MDLATIAHDGDVIGPVAEVDAALDAHGARGDHVERVSGTISPDWAKPEALTTRAASRETMRTNMASLQIGPNIVARTMV